MGKTDCEETFFILKIGFNHLLLNFKKVEWVSHIKLSVSRVVEIQSSFETEVNFHYLSREDDLDELLVDFKKSFEGGKRFYHTQ